MINIIKQCRRKKRDLREKKRQEEEVDLTESGEASCEIERRSGGKWEGQRDEEREARLLGLFAIIGGALTR